MKLNVGRFLARRALLNPGRKGLSFEDREFSFRELNLRANRAAHAMAGLGVRPGDRVGLMAWNGPEYFDLFFGLAKLGALFVPINPRLTVREVMEIVEDSGLRVLVLGPEFREAAESAAAEGVLTISIGGDEPSRDSYERLLARASEKEPSSQAGDDDEALLIYAGWSGGRPRAAALTHKNIFWASATAIATLLQPGPRFLLSLPLCHIGGLGWLAFFAHLGIHCRLMKTFDPELFLERLEAESISSFGAVPTMLVELLHSPRFNRERLKPVQNVFSYGAPASAELIKKYGEAGVMVRQLYGLTECAGPALVIDHEHALEKAGSCGLPFFHTRVKVVDESGEEVRRGEVGEVVIQAEHVMSGYWNQPEATEEALRGGWLYTGDLGRQDEDGYFYIVGRKKDLIITGGENVYPAEVESVLIEHPEVMDAAVLGEPDPHWGERVKAVVMKKPGSLLSQEQLVSWCRERLAGFKIPRSVEFADSIPRSETGKLVKKKLREGENG